MNNIISVRLDCLCCARARQSRRTELPNERVIMADHRGPRARTHTHTARTDQLARMFALACVSNGRASTRMTVKTIDWMRVRGRGVEIIVVVAGLVVAARAPISSLSVTLRSLTPRNKQLFCLPPRWLLVVDVLSWPASAASERASKQVRCCFSHLVGRTLGPRSTSSARAVCIIAQSRVHKSRKSRQLADAGQTAAAPASSLAKFP